MLTTQATVLDAAARHVARHGAGAAVRHNHHTHHAAAALPDADPFSIELSLLLGAALACVVIGLVGVRFTHRVTPAGGERGEAQSARDEATYARLRNRYLGVYALATLGDWIQGGYIYALYAEYGFSLQQIALVFGIGYGSAATLGTYAGAVGDVGGHRRNCVAYGVLYLVSCLLNNDGHLGCLALGRVLGGVAYSILYTSFESWLLTEANACGLPPSMLTRLFSVATFCNASTAVLAGLLGHVVVAMPQLPGTNRYAAPFNAAVVPLGPPRDPNPVRVLRRIPASCCVASLQRHLM